jgi:hypothetical protein
VPFTASSIIASTAGRTPSVRSTFDAPRCRCRHDADRPLAASTAAARTGWIP